MFKHFAMAALACLCIARPASAATITVDEQGAGLPFTIGADPGPGGLANVLRYGLPFAGTQGDVLLIDDDVLLVGGVEGVQDAVRFNGDGTLLFYSDSIGGLDSIGDTSVPPSSGYANQVRINEVDAEGSNGAFYTPIAGQPGYDGSAPTYHFVSDSAPVPEPTSLLLLGSGGVTALIGRMRRRGTSSALPR